MRALGKAKFWRRLAFRSDFRAERENLKGKASQLGYPLLNFSEFRAMDSSVDGVIYILGSGNSVGELTADKFQKISRHASVGINAWAIHEFIPTSYSFEFSKTPGPPGLERTILEQRLARSEVITSQPLLYFLRPAGLEPVKKKFRIADSLGHRARLYGRVSLMKANGNALSEDLTFSLDFLLRKGSSDAIVVDNGASVARLMVISLLAGFKKIVLLGVDLNSSPYFWLGHLRDQYPDSVRLAFPRETRNEHGTMNEATRTASMLQFIVALRDIAKDLFECEIEIGTELSLLSSVLPKHEWSSLSDLT